MNNNGSTSSNLLSTLDLNTQILGVGIGLYQLVPMAIANPPLAAAIGALTVAATCVANYFCRKKCKAPTETAPETAIEANAPTQKPSGDFQFVTLKMGDHRYLVALPVTAPGVSARTSQPPTVLRRQTAA